MQKEYKYIRAHVDEFCCTRCIFLIWLSRIGSVDCLLGSFTYDVQYLRDLGLSDIIKGRFCMEILRLEWIRVLKLHFLMDVIFNDFFSA